MINNLCKLLNRRSYGVKSDLLFFGQTIYILTLYFNYDIHIYIQIYNVIYIICIIQDI